MGLMVLLTVGLVAALVGGGGVAAAEPGEPDAAGPDAAETGTAGLPELGEEGVTALGDVLNGLVGTLGDGQGLPGATRTGQMIVVTAPKATDNKATLTAFEREDDGTWKPVIGPVPADLGTLGMGEPQDNVHRTPQGTFALDQAFGRLENPGTEMPYFQATREDWWDGNPESSTYNTHVKSFSSPGGGSENLYDMGPVYDYAVNIAHNPQRIPGKAAAMFLHVANGAPTWGCVAVDKNSMREILTWLDPAESPKITIGVNQSTPTDETANTSGIPGTGLTEDNPITGLLNQLVNILPALIGVDNGSAQLTN